MWMASRILASSPDDRKRRRAFFSGRCSTRARRVAADLAVSKCNLERLAEDILVAVFRRRRPVVLFQPRVDLRRLDLIGNAITEIFEDNVHPNAEVLDVFAAVFDVPIEGVETYHVKFHAFVLHVRGHLRAPQSVRAPDSVQVDRILETPNLLAVFRPVYLVSNSPNVGTGYPLENTTLFAFHSFLGIAQAS